MAVIQGAVSQKAANRFSLFYHVYSKINAEELYENGIINVPENDMDKFAYSSVITDEFYNRYHKDNEIRNKAAKSYIKFLDKIVNEYHKPELALSSVSNILNRPEAKDLGLTGGIEVFSYLYENSLVPLSLMEILKESSSVLR